MPLAPCAAAPAAVDVRRIVQESGKNLRTGCPVECRAPRKMIRETPGNTRKHQKAPGNAPTHCAVKPGRTNPPNPCPPIHARPSPPSCSLRAASPATGPTSR
ncbi:hypothetical protein RR42_s2828 [Cupriavidus basilensis]|uniref:Uncharacterized protein n=1 Tax=Cupriavidus basilensis TaxID=68895 RepID=A0A0C4YQX6_9BURK|nr:hypothetical protein RR42_s2828 [Cupriavidus basilensis]